MAERSDEQGRNYMHSTILNVDDTEIARYTKRRPLLHAGFKVIDVANGRDALDVLEHMPVPLVLLDVNLPDIDGIEVCRQIKARWPTTMVLQTSASFTSSSDRARGLQGGADGYLYQPIDADELVASVSALLRLHAAESATRALNASLEVRIAERTLALQQANDDLQLQISQRIQAEAALMQAQKMELLGEFSATMAHDFNNILGSITNRVHLAQRMAGEVEVKDQLGKVLETAGRGRTMTARLLAFVRRSELVTSQVDVGRLISDMHEWLSQSAGEQIEVVVDIADQPLVVMTDASQLELAVLNLVINARDAMPSGGIVRVGVATSVVTEPSPDLKCGDYVVVKVEDAGVGMAPDVAARALEAFFTTKPAGRGTGLGLAQVNNLAKLSDGAVRLRSVVGQGTVVEVWLAAAESGYSSPPGRLAD